MSFTESCENCIVPFLLLGLPLDLKLVLSFYPYFVIDELIYDFVINNHNTAVQMNHDNP